MVRKSTNIYSTIFIYYSLLFIGCIKYVINFTVNAPHKINGKQLDVKKALPKDGSEQRGGRQGPGRNDSWGNGGL